MLKNIVAPGRGDNILVVDVSQTRDLPDRDSLTPWPIGVNDFWDVILTQEASQESLCSFHVTVPLKQDIEYKPVLVDRSPKPMADAIDARTHLVQVPP